MMQRSLLSSVFAGVTTVLVAQEPVLPGSLVARSILDWVADYEQQRLSPKSTLRVGGDLQPRYVVSMRRAGLVHEGDEGRVTHLDMLGKLLFFAEKNPSDDLARAVLGVAAAGLEHSLVDRETMEVRELGHWTLVRSEGRGSWFVILRAAAGERLPLFGELQPLDAKAGQGITAGPARRVAALRLLGSKNLPVFRSTLEAALVDPEPRVRLAAAEALSPPWRVETMRAVVHALASERHPVVSQALVRLLLGMLRLPPEDLAVEARAAVVDSALQQLGRCGWRTDMELLDVVEAFPHKDAIPRLIELLDLQIRSPDALVTAVNKRASPLLRQKAGGLLRAMTGAILPDNEPARWREFWDKERERLRVPERLSRPEASRTRATFFDVPVTGASVAFLIDNSGSMDAGAGGAETGLRRRRPMTRLEAAKEQLVLAVQSMPQESTYQVLTFAASARRWTPQPVPADARSLRSLTELLGRIGIDGGTNLHDGLQAALQWQQLRFGEVGKAGIDELFVLSDGEPTMGPVQDPEALLAMVREANKYAHIRIHCVFTGAGQGADLLRQLAEQNGGQFVQR